MASVPPSVPRPITHEFGVSSCLMLWQTTVAPASSGGYWIAMFCPRWKRVPFGVSVMSKDWSVLLKSETQRSATLWALGLVSIRSLVRVSSFRCGRNWGSTSASSVTLTAWNSPCTGTPW